MDAISSALIGKALDGLLMRQTFLAQNIANANSVSYTPMQVSFEAELLAASKDGLPAIDAVSPDLLVMPVTDAQSSDVRIDLQLAESSKTALRYSALVDILGRQMSLTRAAISGGQG